MKKIFIEIYTKINNQFLLRKFELISNGKQVVLNELKKNELEVVLNRL